MKVHCIIPSYNCADWIVRAMDSVHIQEGVDYQAYVIDDASTDPRQRDLIRDFCFNAGVGVFGRWAYMFNDRNMRAGYNLFTGIHAMKPAPDDIVFILDGDDFLPHGRVFERIAAEYEDPDAWFVYGQYEPWPRNTGQVGSRPYPPEWWDDADDGRIRYEENLANHPITFRYWLFSQLTEQDMRDRSGRWFRAGYDRCMFIPMLEMSRHHTRFVNEILYCYNAVNPISDTHVNLADAQAAHLHVRRQPPRAAITDEQAAALRSLR